MAFTHAKDSYVTIDAVNMTPYVDTQSLDRVIELAETNVFGVDDATSIAGVRSHTIQIGGKWDPTGDAAMIAADDGAVVAFAVNPQGNTGGDVTYTGNCLISNYNISASGGAVTWSASFTVSGAVTRGTV